MIVTKKWLEDFIDISKIDIDDICKTLNSIGLEVDSVDKISIPDHVVVGKVLSKVKHPDADKLNVCQVDIGTETVQIVCGAKNVSEGQFVPVAVVGCKLSETFEIKKAKLRGLDSHGMICSSTEIGLPKLNDGILELDDSIGELIIGKELNEYKLLNDDIIEIELTANRGDCLSINGVARELSACYNEPLLEKEKHLNYIDVGIGQVLQVKCSSNIHSSLVFRAANFENFKLPILQQLRISFLDKYSKNNIKNALTYATHSTGVILNAYAKSDAKDKKDENDISVLKIEKSKDGFDEVHGSKILSTISINHEELNENETTFILEASYHNPEELSKTVYEKKKKTGDVFYRTSRGSEPSIKIGMDYFTNLISQFGALVYRGSQAFSDDLEKTNLDIDTKKVSAIIGQNIPKAKIETILSALEFDVKTNGTSVLAVQVPKFRHDIKNIADVTEEIVRIIGIDNIQSKPLQIDEKNRINATTYSLIKKNKLRAKAIENGFFETLTYVFTNRENLLKFNFPVVAEKLDILNPIVNELNTFRTTILLNLVEACSSNFKLGSKKAAFFEIGTIFNQNREESKKISFIYAGDKEEENISNGGKPDKIDFFTFAKKVLNTIGQFELRPIENIENKFIHPHQNANIIIDGVNVGFISKLHPNAAAEYDLPDTCIAEIDFDVIKNDLVKTKHYSKFQASKRDLSIIAPKSMQYSQIQAIIRKINDEKIKQFNLVDTYTDEKLGDKESLTIRFVLQSDDKTLEEQDITSTMDAILETLDKELGIGIR